MLLVNDVWASDGRPCGCCARFALKKGGTKDDDQPKVQRDLKTKAALRCEGLELFLQGAE